MIDYVNKLKKEVDAEIEQIECSEACMIKKSLEASRILAAALRRRSIV